MSSITDEFCTAVKDTEEVENDACKGNNDAIVKDTIQSIGQNCCW